MTAIPKFLSSILRPEHQSAILGYMMRTIALRVGEQEPVSSGFLFPAKPYDILITSAHAAYAIPKNEGTPIQALLKEHPDDHGTWRWIPVKVLAQHGDDMDGVLVLGTTWKLSDKPRIRIDTKVALPSRVLMIGFPYNIRNAPSDSPLPFPMIRSGEVAGLDPAGAIYIDGLSYPGMSGSPVIHWVHGKGWALAAMLSGESVAGSSESLQTYGFLRATLLPDIKDLLP